MSCETRCLGMGVDGLTVYGTDMVKRFGLKRSWIEDDLALDEQC